MSVHSVEPEAGFVHFDFAREREPALWIESGDTVVFRTLDAAGFIEPRTSDRRPPQFPREIDGHALCGPVGIRDARPGQTLEVEIRDIRCGTWGWTGGGGFQSPLNDRLGMSEQAMTILTWDMDPDALTAVNQHGHRVRLRPFMGVMGMPSDEPGPLQTFPPRFCGGNLDCKELVAGTKLYLPIAVDNALFSLGDGHGVQGDGEASGMAIECPMERVEVKLTVLDSPKLTMPRAWTPEAWITFGLHEDLREAVAIALDEMLALMMEGHVLTRAEAIALASLVVDVRITQLVNTVVGAHAVLPHDAVGS